jgi:small subunit ribosomal protein S16
VGAVIKLAKTGATHEAVYRVLVVDSRYRGLGKALETIGTFNMKTKEAKIVISEEKALKWLRMGALPSPRVKGLMREKGIWQKFTAEKIQKKKKTGG